MGHATLERVLLFGTRSADHIRASSHSGCIAMEVTPPFENRPDTWLHPEQYPWLTGLLARKPFRVVAVALANKMARIAWALLAKGGTYRAPAFTAAT